MCLLLELLFDSNHNCVLAFTRSSLQQQDASVWIYSTSLKRLVLNIIISPSSAQPFGSKIRLKISAMLSMETIINLAMNKRKLLPWWALKLEPYRQDTTPNPAKMFSSLPNLCPSFHQLHLSAVPAQQDTSRTSPSASGQVQGAS